MRKVEMIPATKCSAKNIVRIKTARELRVAAYCRVSTDAEEQQNSYANQRAFYTGYINGKEGWRLVGIYADEAISGTSRAHRKEFNRMMEDAAAGKIDYIVTKSISRFARNTVDTLNCVRELRRFQPPVGVYFEKENIDTLDASGELILTILSALAQDESRSISENIRWTFQKNFQEGKPQINLKQMLGYDKGADGAWVINPAQAEVVRFLFQQYVSGYSANAAAKQANEAGMRTVNGKLWTAGAVLNVLRNEKYVGDLEMQKTVTRDFLTHRSVKNHGEAPKYYVKDHHEGIIDRPTWEKVQRMLGAGRNSEKTEDSIRQRCAGKTVFSNLRCGVHTERGVCGGSFRRMTYSSSAHGYRDERSAGFHEEEQTERYVYAYPLFCCTHRRTGNDCTSKGILECALEQSFMEMLYRLKRDDQMYGKDSWLAAEFERVCEIVERCGSIKRGSVNRKALLDGQIRETERYLEQIKVSVDEGRQGMLGSEVLRSRLECYRQERAALEAEQGETAAMKKNYALFLECLRELPECNPAGMPIKINGLDTQGTLFREWNGRAKKGMRSAVSSGKIRITPEHIANAPDYIKFEKGIYAVFIQNGKVCGDEVDYITNFGVQLKSYGNSRTLSSFLGYRRCPEDGKVEFLDELWKVNGRKMRYYRTERKNKNAV